MAQASYNSYLNTIEELNLKEYWNATMFLDTLTVTSTIICLGTWIYSILDSGLSQKKSIIKIKYIFILSQMETQESNIVLKSDKKAVLILS